MKTYTIAKFKQPSFHSVNTREPKPYLMTGTISELVKSFSYTLECGKSYEHEKGNSKINMNPKGIKSLVNMLNKAVNNSAANGYSNISYKQAE